MARADNTYSRVVAWMKVLLPLFALGLLSTLFLISRTVDPSKSVPVGNIDLEQRAQELGVTNPSFAGVTDKGDEIAFAADLARPEPDRPRQLVADRVMAEMRLAGGTVIVLRAGRGKLDQEAMTAALLDEVHVTTSTGYVLDTERLDARLDVLHAESTGQVTATGPIGTLEAGRMVLRNNAETGSAELFFTGGVMLIYHPRTTGEKDE